MTARTHDLAAFTALNLVFVFQSPPDYPLSTIITSLGACFLGGVIPDIDTPSSEFWQNFPAGTMLGRLLHPFVGAHRHISHSLLGIIIFGIISDYLFSIAGQVILVDMNLVWICFMVGIFSHLFADSFTRDGVPWFFPIPIGFGFPPLKFLRIKTGGLMEKAIFFPLLILINGFIFYNFYPLYINYIQNFIK